MCAHSQPGDRGSRRDAGQCSTPVTQTTFLQQVPASPLPREGLLSGAEVLPCTKPAQPCRNQPPKPHRARDGGRGQQGAGEALLSLSCFWESQEKEKEVDTLRTPKDSRSHGGFLTLRGSPLIGHRGANESATEGSPSGWPQGAGYSEVSFPSTPSAPGVQMLGWKPVSSPGLAVLRELSTQPSSGWMMGGRGVLRLTDQAENVERASGLWSSLSPRPDWHQQHPLGWKSEKWTSNGHLPKTRTVAC